MSDSRSSGEDEERDRVRESQRLFTLSSVQPIGFQALADENKKLREQVSKLSMELGEIKLQLVQTRSQLDMERDATVAGSLAELVRTRDARLDAARSELANANAYIARQGVRIGELEAAGKAVVAAHENTVRPPHYGGDANPFEPIKVIEAWQLSFGLGSAVKYIARHGKKRGENASKDLRKAAYYLTREADRLDAAEALPTLSKSIKESE